MSRIAGVFFIVLMVVDVTTAHSQTPYGIPVAPPQEPASPNTVGPPVPTVPTSPRGAGGGSLFRITPSISISERYDSNVLYLPKAVHDYVTSITPGASVNFANDWFDTASSVSLMSEIYTLNPGLNYVGGAGSVSANLDNAVGRMIRGATLSIADSAMYTPRMPGFAPASGNLLPAEFVRGVQAYRNNVLTNSLTAEAGYTVTQRLNATALYSYSIMRFLSDSSVQQARGALFNTTTSSLTVGPQYSLSSNHRIGLSYQHQVISFQSAVQGTISTGRSITPDTTIQGVSATWNGTLSRALSVTISPGVSKISGLDSPQFTATTQIQWTTTQTTASLGYTRGIYPSFYFQSAIFVSDMVTASGTYKVGGQWMLNANANYSMNRGVGFSQSGGSFDSDGMAAEVGAMYEIDPTMSVRADFSYSKYSYQFSGFPLDVNRNALMLQFRKEWR